MKRFNELQENSEQQLKELRSKINEQKELFTKETKKKCFFNKETDKNSGAEKVNDSDKEYIRELGKRGRKIKKELVIQRIRTWK